MKSLGLIGAGKIGSAVAAAVDEGIAGKWRLAGVLTRQARMLGGQSSHTDPDVFFTCRYDLIIDTAGPGALRQLGARSLQHADVWSVSAVALADPQTGEALVAAARTAGHQLRILPGAIAAVDALKGLAIDPACTLQIDVEMPDGAPGPAPFDGSAGDAARLFPDNVNIAVAAALAGPGLERTQVRVSRHTGSSRRSISLRAVSGYGQITSTFLPVENAAEMHPVSAALIAALRDYSTPLAIF